jgi:hypothetical protein
MEDEVKWLSKLRQQQMKDDLKWNIISNARQSQMEDER